MPQSTLRPAHAAPRRQLHHISSRPALPRYEISGPDHAPLIVVLGGISATAHVTATPSDPTPGWWSEIVGRAKGIDTRRYRVLSIDYLDGRGHDAFLTEPDALGNILEVAIATTLVS